MPLQITIHDPRTYYTANSPIRGTVHLTGSSDVDVGQILIIFSGRSESKIEISSGAGKNKKTNTYHGLVPLFHYETVLFTGPRTLHPNQHSWDFSFQFPPRCDSRGGDQFGGPTYNFNDDPHQALPPSFDLPGLGLSRRVSGFVCYELEAQLVRDRSKLFASRGSETVERLLVKTSRDVAEPDPQAYTLYQAISCKSMHLLPGYEDRSLTLREKMHSMRSSNLPTANFQLELRLPTTGVMGWGLPMFLEVNHEIDHSTKQAPPVIYLKRVKVTIETLGTARCLQFRSIDVDDNQRVEAFDRATIIREYDGLKNLLPITEPIDLRKLLNLHLDPQVLAPGFSTFNFEVRHALTVKVAVECARKTFKAEWCDRELLVYPELYQAPTLMEGKALKRSEGQSHAPQPPGTTAQPPRYEDTPRDNK